MRFLCILVAVVAAFATVGSSLASENGYLVIVNPDNHLTEIDRDFVRDVYLKKATAWGRGQSIQPIDLGSKFLARELFIHEVIRKTPAQLKNYWNQQIFSGKGVPPPESDSPAAIIAYVATHPGAIGYIPSSMDPGAAKVVRVK